MSLSTTVDVQYSLYPFACICGSALGIEPLSQVARICDPTLDNYAGSKDDELFSHDEDELLALTLDKSNMWGDDDLSPHVQQAAPNGMTLNDVPDAVH